MYLNIFTIDTNEKLEDSVQKHFDHLALTKHKLNSFILIIILYTIINCIDKFKFKIVSAKSNLIMMINLIIAYGLITN